MNPVLEKTLSIASSSNKRSEWFRHTLNSITKQEDHLKAAFGALELIRVAIHRQSISIARSWNSDDSEPKLKTDKPRLGELSELAVKQYLGLPVPEPDLDYNRFLLRYCESAGWLYQFDQDRDFSDFDHTGIFPPILRAKDPANPPALWGKQFTAPDYVQPLEKSLDAEIKRIEASHLSAPWLTQAIAGMPEDTQDVYYRGVLAEVRSLLRWAAAIHRDTPADLKSPVAFAGEVSHARGFSGDPEVRNVFRKIPNEAQKLPRDGYSMGVTQDIPLLAMFLAREVDAILEVKDERLDPHWFLDLKEAQRFSEDNWLKAPTSYSRSKIYDRFDEIFWGLRRLLSVELQYQCTITSGELTLRHPDHPSPSPELVDFAAALKHPFVPGEDPFISNPDKIDFYQWEPTEPGVTFCPIDGAVHDPLLIKHFGRGSIDDITVCPHCLGALYWKELIHFSH